MRKMITLANKWTLIERVFGIDRLRIVLLANWLQIDMENSYIFKISKPQKHLAEEMGLKLDKKMDFKLDIGCVLIFKFSTTGNNIQ